MADTRIEFLCRHFFARRDVVAVLAPWGTPCPAAVDSLEGIVESHVLGTERTISIYTKNTIDAQRGKWRVGTYCSDPNGSTTWCCIDIDGSTGEHHHPVADAAEAAKLIAARCQELGVTPLVELSGSAKGWHVWVFFAEPVPVSTARKVGCALIPEGIKLVDGKNADVDRSRGLEVFPKTQTKAKVGTMVWLPWWSGAKSGGNLFHPDPPAEPVRLALEKVNELAALAKETRGEKKEKDKREREEKASQAVDFAGWRREALGSLDLRSIYGEWLTGKSGSKGWLECRDPNSASGDRRPSAGVADGTGEAERGAFHTFRESKTISIFDFLMQRNSCTFRQAAELVAGLAGVPLPAHAPEAPVDSRPTIIVGGRQLKDVIDDSWKAVKKHNSPPLFFLRGGLVSRVVMCGRRRSIEPASSSVMFGQLVRAARWVMEKKDILIDVAPNKDVAQDMLDFPDVISIPEIEAIVQCPVFDAQGKLVTGNGYHEESKLWVEGDGEFDVPETPTKDDVMKSIALIWEAIGEFPFDSEGDRANAIAMMICPFVRRMIKGVTPLHLVEAPTPGSGKGLLADIGSIILTGDPVPVSTMSENAEETRKRLTSILIEASPFIMLDNVSGDFSSAEICAAVTSPVWKDRVLGVNRMVTLDNQATWIVTANNPTLSKEISRRCVRIRIDPKMNEPWKRKTFKHPMLRNWVIENRSQLVSSVLCLVKNWQAQGSPLVDETLGSFEHWSRLMGGILKCAGISGFLSNLDKMYDEVDYLSREWRHLVATWWEVKSGKTVSIFEILEMVDNERLLPSIVTATYQKAKAGQLEHALRAQKDVMVGAFRIELLEDQKTHASIYRLVRCEEATSAGALRLD